MTMRIEDIEHHQGELQRSRDRRLSAAFESGAYAAAYEAKTYQEQLAGLDARRYEYDAAYRAAFTLGFYATHERDEIPPGDLAAYDAALTSWAGQRCVELGFVDRCFIGGPDPAPALVCRQHSEVPRDRVVRNASGQPLCPWCYTMLREDTT